ncbi:unnamed protein product, partial [marine sediment metagenome]
MRRRDTIQGPRTSGIASDVIRRRGGGPARSDIDYVATFCQFGPSSFNLGLWDEIGIDEGVYMR